MHELNTDLGFSSLLKASCCNLVSLNGLGSTNVVGMYALNQILFIIYHITKDTVIIKQFES
jgi:hypothetical protein